MAVKEVAACMVVGVDLGCEVTAAVAMVQEVMGMAVAGYSAQAMTVAEVTASVAKEKAAEGGQAPVEVEAMALECLAGVGAEVVAVVKAAVARVRAYRAEVDEMVVAVAVVVETRVGWKVVE